jgi:hypothetical protein
MVEVFKTNVTSVQQAQTLVRIIREHFDGYKVNFDLDDCDRILRIEAAGMVEAESVIGLLKDMNVVAEILSDEPVLLIIT